MSINGAGLDREIKMDYKYQKAVFDMTIDISSKVSFTIGNNQRNDIYIPDGMVSYYALELRRLPNGYEINCSENKYGYFVNGVFEKSQTRTVKDYSFVAIGGIIFYLEPSSITTSSKAEISTSLPFTKEVQLHRRIEYPAFYLTARDEYKLPDEKIEVMPPEAVPTEPKKNLLITVTPMLVSLLLMVFLRGSMMGGSAGYILYFAATMIVGILTSIWMYFDNGKDFRKKVAQREKVYTEYIVKKEEEIQKFREDEKAVLLKRNPSLEETVKRILIFDPKLFEKKNGQEDYLDVRIGTGMTESLRQIDYRAQDYVNVYDKLMDYPQLIHDKYEYIEDMPVVLHLAKVNAVGFIGNRTMLYHMLKNLIITLAAQESLTDIKMVLMLEELYVPYLEWVRWIPGFTNDVTGARNIMFDEESNKKVLEFLYAELSIRETLKKEDVAKLPNYIIFAFRSERLCEFPVSNYIERAKDLGFTFIFFEEERELLHKACDVAVYLYDEEYRGHIQDLKDSQSIQYFSYTHMDKEIAEKCALKLAPVFIRETSLESNLTKSISLFQLMGIRKVDDIDLAQRWADSKVHESMAAPLGVKSGDEIVYLDIHEKYHGPHGLVAGTTGSGKSEIIQTYILSMATLFHPYEVGFIIIDFKGGGMANQFKNLPHLNGTITNIDGKQINRSLMSIKAELIKRQELFAKYEVNKIDDYIKLFKSGVTDTPLPHLILIVDEFAELKSEQPDFMKELISAARIGRSLGVHLILATQKPAGVVNDQIWSNSKFKLCLKVQDKTDSNEVLKSPLAAEIREPGRAYLQVGNNEIFQLFQSAYSGAVAEENVGEIKREYSISSVDLMGNRNVIFKQKNPKGEGSQTQLEAIVDYVDKYCKDEGIAKLQEICLPPLSDHIEYPETIEVKGTDIVVPIGIYDDPARQQQKELSINFTQNHTFILGSSLSGKTYLLQNMIYGLTNYYSPEDVNIYIVDFASMILKTFSPLSHVGGVVTLVEEDKLAHLMEMMTQKIQERRKLLSDAGLSSYGAYREAGNKDMPQIVLILENYSVFRSTYEDLEDEFLGICRDGVAAGISCVVTNQQLSGMGYKLLTNFAVKIAMNCNDSGEYSGLIDRCRTKPDEFPGRGLTVIDNEIMEFQSYIAFSGEKETDRIYSIRDYIDKINTKYEGYKAETIVYIPEQLTDEYMQERFGTSKMQRYKVLAGLGYATTLPEYNDLETNIITGILGQDELGRSNYVNYLIKKLLENDQDNPVEMYIVDNSSRELGKYASESCVREYTTDKMEVVDFVERAYETAKDNHERVLDGESIEDEPLMVLIINDSKVPDIISDNEDLYKKYNELVSDYKQRKVAIIYTNVQNEPLTVLSNPVLLGIKDSGNVLMFEALGDIEFISIPPLMLMKVKKDPGKGDAFYLKGSTIKRIKTAE